MRGVGPDSTIGDLKVSIDREIGLNPAHQQLLYLGQILADARTLKEVGLQDGATRGISSHFAYKVILHVQ